MGDGPHGCGWRGTGPDGGVTKEGDMRVTLNFKADLETRIRKALNGEGSVETQMEHIILRHVGQTELNAIAKEKQDEREKRVKELDEEKQKGINEAANAISKELGL
jgi:hypothetical protein